MRLSILILFLCPYLQAAPYIEYKNEVKYLNSSHTSTVNHIIGGYEFKTGNLKLYGEAGYTTEGTSIEVGYKFKPLKNLTLKGKWEGVDREHKLETEVRYTF